jgi:hypothetical protein
VLELLGRTIQQTVESSGLHSDIGTGISRGCPVVRSWVPYI